jgi:hypothetical protein
MVTDMDAVGDALSTDLRTDSTDFKIDGSDAYHLHSDESVSNLRNPFFFLFF